MSHQLNLPVNSKQLMKLKKKDLCELYLNATASQIGQRNHTDDITSSNSFQLSPSQVLHKSQFVYGNSNGDDDDLNFLQGGDKGNDFNICDRNLDNFVNLTEKIPIDDSTKNKTERTEAEDFIDIKFREIVRSEVNKEIRQQSKLVNNEQASTTFNSVCSENSIIVHLKAEIVYLKQESMQKNKFIESLLETLNKYSVNDAFKVNHSLNDQSGIAVLQPANDCMENLLRNTNKHNDIIAKHNDSIANVNKNNSVIGKERQDAPLSKVAIIGDSILNNIEGNGISKHGNVNVVSHSGSTSEDLKSYIKPIIDRRPDVLVLHIGSNDLTKKDLKTDNEIDTIANLQNIINKVKKSAAQTRIAISSLIIRQDRPNIEKRVEELNGNLKTLCEENLIDYIEHSNIDESCLGIKKLHPNKKGKAYLAKNFIRYLSTI